MLASVGFITVVVFSAKVGPPPLSVDTTLEQRLVTPTSGAPVVRGTISSNRNSRWWSTGDGMLH